jgi:hypothetical protein
VTSLGWVGGKNNAHVPATTPTPPARTEISSDIVQRKADREAAVPRSPPYETGGK